MAVHYTETLTRGVFTAFGTTFYGWNPGSGGSITDATYRFWELGFIQWSSTLGLQVSFTNNIGDGRWGYIQINGTKFLRPDRDEYYAWDGSQVEWRWTGVSNPFPSSGNYTIRIGYENPDTGVTVTAPSTIAREANYFTITINGIDSPYTGRLYGVALSNTDTSEILEVGPNVTPFNTTTGATSSSVSLTVDANMPNPGGSRTYYLYAARSGSTGGAGGSGNEGTAAWVRTGNSFTVSKSATSSLPSNPPTPTGYGLAIWNASGQFITGFTTEKMLNKRASGTFSAGNSTKSIPSDLTNTNCMIVTAGTASATTGAGDPATHISSSGTLNIVGAPSSGSYTILQHEGLQPSGYGLYVENGYGEGIINQDSVVYGVREIITIPDTSWTNQAQTSGDPAISKYTVVTLTAGRYPVSAGAPLIALWHGDTEWLLRPMVYDLGGTGYFNRVRIYVPAPLSGDLKMAVCVSSDISTPPGAASYGLRIIPGWDSGWQQAVVQDVVNINRFTVGLQNNANDAINGYRGVSAPLETSTEVKQWLDSEGEEVSASTRPLDPANTWVGFNTSIGRVIYNGGDWVLDSVLQDNRGGGVHYPAVRLGSTSSIDLHMFRVTDFYSGSYAKGSLVSSRHPDGEITLLRII